MAAPVEHGRRMGVPVERSGALVRLMDLVPELADGLSPRAAEVARQTAAASVMTMPAGIWEPDPVAAPGLLGYMVISGYLLRKVTLHGTAASELLGRGDLLRPHDDPAADGLLVM